MWPVCDREMTKMRRNSLGLFGRLVLVLALLLVTAPQMTLAASDDAALWLERQTLSVSADVNRRADSIGSSRYRTPAISPYRGHASRASRDQ